VKFVAATRGASSFDSYAAAISLVNAFLAEYIRLTPASVRARYALQEALFRHFDVFTWHEKLPNGSSPGMGAGRTASRGNGRGPVAAVSGRRRRTGRGVLSAGGITAAPIRRIGGRRKE
jgi:hypothetical protein